MGVCFKTAITATVLLFHIVDAQPRREAIQISGRIIDQTGVPLSNRSSMRVFGSSRDWDPNRAS
jgi:hypothetical protein